MTASKHSREHKRKDGVGREEVRKDPSDTNISMEHTKPHEVVIQKEVVPKWVSNLTLEDRTALESLKAPIQKVFPNCDIDALVEQLDLSGYLLLVKLFTYAAPILPGTMVDDALSQLSKARLTCVFNSLYNCKTQDRVQYKLIFELIRNHQFIDGNKPYVFNKAYLNKDAVGGKRVDAVIESLQLS